MPESRDTMMKRRRTTSRCTVLRSTPSIVIDRPATRMNCSRDVGDNCALTTSISLGENNGRCKSVAVLPQLATLVPLVTNSDIFSSAFRAKSVYAAERRRIVILPCHCHPMREWW